MGVVWNSGTVLESGGIRECGTFYNHVKHVYVGQLHGVWTWDRLKKRTGHRERWSEKLEEGDLHIYCRSAQRIEQLRHRWLN